MHLAAHLAALIAVVITGVVYGTDVFCALVQRPALARVDDTTLTSVMGDVHRFGDPRLPVPGDPRHHRLRRSHRPRRTGRPDRRISDRRNSAGTTHRLGAALPARQRAHQPRAHHRRRQPRDAGQRTRTATRLGPRHRAAGRPARPGHRRAVRQPHQLTGLPMPNLASTMMTADPQNKQPGYSLHGASAIWRPARRDRSAASVPTGADAHDGRGAATEALISDVPALPGVQRTWCGKLSICPKLIVPLQIDLAIEVRRYLLDCSANLGPGDEDRSVRTAGRARSTVDARVLAQAPRQHWTPTGRPDVGSPTDRGDASQVGGLVSVSGASNRLPSMPPRHPPSVGQLLLPPRRGRRRCGLRPARRRRW